MTIQSLQSRMTDEIHDVHVFFEKWFRGELPESRDAFSRVERALGTDFRMITPGGELLERAPLIESLWNAHSTAQGRFEIEVKNVRAPVPLWDGRNVSSAGGPQGEPDGGRSWLVLYEEWQWRGDERTARLSSAWLDEGPGGTWVWRHVHETWMPGH